MHIGGGHLLYNMGGDVSMRGQFEGLSDRAASITVNINSRYSLQVIQMYAPTNSHEDWEVEERYEEISQAMDRNQNHYQVIIGDFNAKIGKRQQSDRTTTEMHSLGKRNSRGEMMVQFAASKSLTTTSTLFKKSKKRKLTWRSLNGQVMNEIDYILTNKREIMCHETHTHPYANMHIFVRQFCSGSSFIYFVLLLQRVNIASDHMERSRMMRSPVPKINIEALPQRLEEFQIKLRNRFAILGNDFEDTEESAKQPSNAIHECSEKVAGKVKNRKEEKFKPETKAMLKKCRKMIRKTTRDNIEYTELCKIIRKTMRKDLREANTKRVKDPIETSIGLKKCTTEGKTALIQALKEKDGRETTDRKRILERCAEFYKELYEDPLQNTQKTPEETPQILTSEVEKAVQQMKNGKSPGEDHVFIEMIKAGG